MWANRTQVDGRGGPGLVMPVLLPLLLATVLAVLGLYGSTFSHTVEAMESGARTSLQADLR